MDLGIQQKKALVCASSKGLGKAITWELAREGAAVFMCAREEDSLRATAHEIQHATGADIRFMAADLSLAESREGLIRAVTEGFGHVDILVHNVGGPKPSTVEETTLDAWEQGFRQNFLSIAHLNQAFLPQMKANRWGRILIVTSISVVEPVAGLAVSNGVRAAVTNMAKTLADEVAPENICVNCLAPGIIHTDRIESLMEASIQKTGQSREQYLAETAGKIPMRRLGRPEEFAAAAAFLCSERASYITGSTLLVDGGKRRAAY